MKFNFLEKVIKCIALMLIMLWTIGCAGKTYEVSQIADAHVLTNVADTSSSSAAVTTQTLQEPTPTPTALVLSDVSLVMVGDVLLHTPVEESCKQADGSYNFHSLFTNVEDEVKNADLALVNQEVIIGGNELGISGYPAFNAPFEAGDALADAGFDIILHATNHSLDKGVKGISNCLTFWASHYPQVAVLGINESQEAQDTIYIYERNNIRVAILNYTYGTNGIPLPEKKPFAVNLLEREKVEKDLAKAEEIADFIIVCPHWGTEYVLNKTENQEYWTQIFVQNGADLILGTHPHVIEPIEWVENQATGNKALVYYSLGNFTNWTSGVGEGIANRMVGGMAKVTIGLDAQGKVCIKEYGVQALVCHLQEGENGVTTYFLSDYTQEQALKNEIVKQDSTFTKQYCDNLCDSVWGDLWE